MTIHFELEMSVWEIIVIMGILYFPIRSIVIKKKDDE